MTRPAASRLRRDLALILVDGVAFSVMVGIGEAYLAPFALALGMGEVAAGLISSLPMVAGGVFQLVTPSALRFARSYRAWTVTWVALQAASFAPLVVAALVGGAPAGLVFAAAALYWGAGMAATPAWNAWMTQIIPLRLRSRYFAHRQGAGQVGVLVGLVAGGLVLHVAEHSRFELAAFAALFAAAGLCRVLSSALLAAHSQPDPPPRPRAIPLARVIGHLWRSRSRDIIFGVVGVNAAVNLAGPFLVPYLLAVHHMPYGSYMAQLAFFFVGKVVAYRLLSRVATRFRVRQLLAVGALGIAPVPLLWLISASPWWFLVAQTFSGVAWASFELAMFLSFLDVPDDDERTSLLSSYNALNSLVVAAASLLGGATLGALGGGASAYHLIFLLSSAGRFGALLFVLRRARRGFVTNVPALRILAVRPWGEVIVRPVLATLGLGKREVEDDDEPE